MMAEQFGHTWWGKAWVQALEERAALDPSRLSRGRTYARQDRVTSLTLEPGVVAASVRGSQRLNYRTHIEVRTYGDDEWAKVVATIAQRAGHTAAVLDGELEPGIVEDAREAGVELLPGRGDLRPRCSCPDSAATCKHVAAVAYLVAEVLDDDPFQLFALRGRTREAFLAELRTHRRTGGSAGPEAEDADEAALAQLVAERASGEGGDPGELARQAWARERPPLPPLPDLPSTPGTPASWPEDPPAGAPFDTPGLLILARDAASRAWAQLRGDASSGLALSSEADLARREADELTGELASGSIDISSAPSASRDLTHRAQAWRHGGEAGLAMLGESAWRPPVATMAAARASVEGAGIAPGVLTVTNNRITGPGFQLRLSRQGQWWRFEKRKNRWEITAPPEESADDLLLSS